MGWGENHFKRAKTERIILFIALLTGLFIYLWNMCLLYNRKIYSHLTPEFVFLAPYSTVNYSSLKWQEMGRGGGGGVGGGFSPCTQTPPPQTDFKPEVD